MKPSNTKTIKQSPAQKRYAKAAEYLKSQGININSRADDHYRAAIQIAAGLKKGS